MAYEVRILQRAHDFIKGLTKLDQKRIYDEIGLLQTHPRPRGSIKLRGYEAYRLRVGDYRIIYTIRDRQLLVVVVAAGNRRDIYQILQRLGLTLIP